MPFENLELKLTGYKPSRRSFDSRDRLRIDLDNGESVVVMYGSRTSCIMNDQHHGERYRLDHRRAPGALMKWATPSPERLHAGFYVRIGWEDRRLELTLVSQEYIGQLLTVAPVVDITSVRTTTHTDLTYIEQTPIQSTRRRPVSA